MITYILLFIIALLVGVIIFLLVRNVQSLKLLRKQHLQIIADAEFRGYVIKGFGNKNTITKQQVHQALMFSGINTRQ